MNTKKTWFTDKLEKLLPDELMIRYHADHTDDTDDSGNTLLEIALICLKDRDKAIDEDRDIFDIDEDNLRLLLQGAFDSSGDHFEEITLQTQNNEFLIIFNANK